MPDRATFKGEHWKNYVTANKEFAKCTIRALRQLPRNNTESQLIWVHDYHLMLTSNWIRKYADDEGMPCKLGFFLHIPFPPWGDIFRLFPWSHEIYHGKCEMVGFHVTDYCLNFVDCCQRKLGCRLDRKNLLVEHGDRTVRVRPLPIGIPLERFVELAEQAPRVISTNQKIILGVDRLDYIKGLVHRLLAFEKLMEKVSLLQIAVPSRTDVKEYQELKEEMDQLASRNNGWFTTPNWSPIRYIYGSLSQDE
ncbi:unnamed protein product [Ceutorhynchus assimilis]|uniref:Trehalose-6-phosphate synthase n=1 Tax=Ceutorhynchus assimilis TaxID=467358 RepID=A0A9N9MMQ4_9CUCU|nr:unnamed protein product [Ceutorhynchus assimilis]